MEKVCECYVALFLLDKITASFDKLYNNDSIMQETCLISDLYFSFSFARCIVSCLGLVQGPKVQLDGPGPG